MLNKGFTDAPVTGPGLEEGTLDAQKPGPHSQAMFAYVRAIGLRAGDVLELSLRDPEDWSIGSLRVAPLDAPKAQFGIYVHAQRPDDGWRPGIYEALFHVRRAGRVVRESRFELKMGR